MKGKELFDPFPFYPPPNLPRKLIDLEPLNPEVTSHANIKVKTKKKVNLGRDALKSWIRVDASKKCAPRSVTKLEPLPSRPNLPVPRDTEDYEMDEFECDDGEIMRVESPRLESADDSSELSSVDASLEAKYLKRVATLQDLKQTNNPPRRRHPPQLAPIRKGGSKVQEYGIMLSSLDRSISAGIKKLSRL